MRGASGNLWSGRVVVENSSKSRRELGKKSQWASIGIVRFSFAEQRAYKKSKVESTPWIIAWEVVKRSLLV